MNIKLKPEQQKILLTLARNSILHGCQNRSPLKPDEALREQAELQQIACAFVTLKKIANDKSTSLRGCVGAISATEPLIDDVVEHAYAAAFNDTRFPPVQESEVPNLQIAISVISPHEKLTFNNEAALLGQLRPGVDGLILSCRGRRATFLPSVWEQLPDKKRFLSHLKEKAGLPGNYWDTELQASRYQSLYFYEPL